MWVTHSVCGPAWKELLGIRTLGKIRQAQACLENLVHYGGKTVDSYLLPHMQGFEEEGKSASFL